MDASDSCFFEHSNDEHNNQYGHYSDRELGNKITLLAGQINAANYRFLKMLSEFDRRKGWNHHGMRSCSQWLNWKCSMTYPTASDKLRVAHALEKLPNINHAFESGELSYSKVRAMTRVATDDNEEVLLRFAAECTASHMDKLVREYQRVDENQNPVEQVDEYEKRKLNYYQDEEGMWVLRTRLPLVEGGLLIKALEEIMRQQHKKSSAEDIEKVTNGQKRADAISALAEHFIATATVDDENDGVQPLAGHERCQVVLHLNVDTLKAEHEHDEHCDCNTPPNIDGQWISMENAKRFSSDASLYTVLEDKYGNVLNIGRKTRTITTALRRALDLRDKTCRFPGCCCNKYLDFHHIKHWAESGETEPDNLIKLCRFHHDLLHKGHYTIAVQQQTEQNFGQKWVFRTADGEIIEPNPMLPIPRDNNYMALRWPDIDSRTGVSFWRGGPMNYPKALRDLFWCEHQKKFA